MVSRFCVGIRKVLFQNIRLKMFALLVGVSLWFYVSISESKIGYFPGDLPIQVKNVPEGLVAIYDEQNVRLKLQAPPNIWRQLEVDDFLVWIDLNHLEEGIHVVDINAIPRLPGVIVLKKEPSTLMVNLEAIIQKEVPVKVILEGKARKGFIPSEPIVKPDKVQIEGAKSLVEQVSHVEARIKLAGETGYFQKRVPVVVYDDNGREQIRVRAVPKNVEVWVTMIPLSGVKTVGIRVRIKGRPKPEYYISKIECSPATVDIFSTTGILPSILNLETEEIDIEGKEESFETEVALAVPDKISLREKKVRIKVILTPNIVERQLPATHYYKLSPGFRVVSIDPVQVIVSGPANTINQLNSNKVIVTFDLTGQKPNTHLVNIAKDMISVPKDCFAISWLPSAAKVVLEKYE